MNSGYLMLKKADIADTNNIVYINSLKDLKESLASSSIQALNPVLNTGSIPIHTIR